MGNRLLREIRRTSKENSQCTYRSISDSDAKTSKAWFRKTHPACASQGVMRHVKPPQATKGVSDLQEIEA
jgi:hypothetical protein